MFGSPEYRRGAFKDFIIERAKAHRDAEIEYEVEAFDIEMSGPHGSYITDEFGRTVGHEEEEPLEDDERTETVEQYRENLVRQREKEDGEVISKIMAAYDRMHDWREDNSENASPVFIEYDGNRS